MKDVTVFLKDEVGALAKLAETIGDADINLEGGCGTSCENKGVIHFLVKDAESTKKVLDNANYEYKMQDVLVFDVENKPKVLAKFCRKMANEGINIELMYIAMDNRLVVGVDNLEKASSVLK